MFRPRRTPRELRIPVTGGTPRHFQKVKLPYGSHRVYPLPYEAEQTPEAPQGAGDAFKVALHRHGSRPPLRVGGEPPLARPVHVEQRGLARPIKTDYSPR